jgi:Tol biopolymer transport system component
VTKLDATTGEIGHRWPKHVDAQHFLFTVQAARTEATGIYLATVGSAAVSRLVPQYSNTAYYNRYVLYVADGAIVARPLDPVRGTVGSPVELAGPVAYTSGLGFSAFSVAANLLSYAPGTGAAATSSTQWFDRLGKPLGRLGEGADLSNYNNYYPAISPDGRQVAISAFQSATADLWLVDTERDVSSRFTFNDATEFSPVWSPDGTELLYASNREGFYNIYRQSVSRPAEEHRLAEAAAHQYPTDWSPDGRTIVLTNVDPRTQADIWTMPAAGGPQTPLLATSFNEYAARLSPDGQWLAYTSDESGRLEVYALRFPSGRDKTQLSTQGGSLPQWRADGRELFYLDANRTVSAVAVTLGAVLKPGRPIRVFDVPVDTSIGSLHAVHFAVSPDGQRFLLGVSAINQTTTSVVMNWEQRLNAPRDVGRRTASGTNSPSPAPPIARQ